MACARSGSIFCWPRAVVFLTVLCELAYFDLLLWVEAAVLDFGCALDFECVLAAECAEVWALPEEDELPLLRFAAAVVCFLAPVFAVEFDEVFAFAVVDFAVLALAPLVFPSVLDDCPSTAEAQTHISASAQPAPSHLRALA